MFNISIIIALSTAVLSIGLSAIFNRSVSKQSQGNKKTVDEVKITLAEVKKSLSKQNSVLIAMSALIFVIILYLLNWTTAIGFLIGAIATIAIHVVLSHIIISNSGRVAEASRRGVQACANLALRLGSIVGLVVCGLSLLIVAGFYVIFQDTQSLVGLGFGVCLLAFFIKFSGKLSKEYELNVNSLIGFFELTTLAIIIAMVLGQMMFKGTSNAVLFPILLASASTVVFVVTCLFARFFKKTKTITAVIIRTITIEIVLFAAAAFFAYVWMMQGVGIRAMVNFYGLAIISLILLFLAGVTILLDNYRQVAKNAALIADKVALPSDTVDHLTAMSFSGKVFGFDFIKTYTLKGALFVSLSIFAGYYKTVQNADKAFSMELSNYLVMIGLFVGALAASLFYLQKIRYNVENTNKIILLCSIVAIVPVIMGLTLGSVALGGFVIGVMLTGLFAATFHSQSFTNIIKVSSIIALLIASYIV